MHRRLLAFFLFGELGVHNISTRNQYVAGILLKYWQSRVMISTGIHSFEYSLLLILTATYAYHNDSV
jgi:hypothetical protein